MKASAWPDFRINLYTLFSSLFFTMTNITGFITQNATQIEPISGVLSYFFKLLSALVGGLFGLYFIFLLLRFLYDRKILKEVRELKREVQGLKNEIRNSKKRV